MRQLLTTLTIPARRDEQETVLTVEFKRDESVPDGHLGRWSLCFYDSRHPTLDPKDMIWQDYVHPGSSPERLLAATKLTVGSNFGDFQIARRELDLLQRQAVNLGIIDRSDIVVCPGPRGRLSALASDLARLVPSSEVLTACRRKGMISL
jgi:hypothetical protein